MDKSLNGLLKSRKFWLAVFGVAGATLFYFLPDFPTSIWLAFETLVIVLIMSIAYEDGAKKRGPPK
jgi:molybdopterin biosynthesis enzyme